MKRDFERRFAVLWIAVMMACSPGCEKPWGNSAERAAAAAIHKLGGKVELEGQRDEQHVVKVYLHNIALDDDDLAPLGQFSKLRNLFLGNTQIGDKALEHLHNLGELQTLSLNSTRVTDKGLQHLAKLTKLRTLNLQETDVTAAGVTQLRTSLPDTTVAR